MKMLNVPPSSRASPLPQVLVVYAKAAYTPNPLWERAGWVSARFSEAFRSLIRC